MKRSELDKLCAPLKPEEVLQHLQELQEALHRTYWGSDWWPALTVGVNVLQTLVTGQEVLEGGDANPSK